MTDMSVVNDYYLHIHHSASTQWHTMSAIHEDIRGLDLKFGPDKVAKQAHEPHLALSV